MLGKLRNMTALYLLKGDKVLLLFRQGGRVVNEVWTGSAGGLCEDDIEELSLRYIAFRRTEKEIRQNYHFFAKLKEEVNDDLKSNEGTLKWFTLDETHGLEMPYSAKYMMEHYCKIGQFTDKLYVGATHETGVAFMELQVF